MPSGVEDDVCEFWEDTSALIKAEPEWSLRTKPEVLHAESNTLLKLAKNGGMGAKGATLYTTVSPCPECAKLIKQAEIKRVVFRHQYRLTEGIDLLRRLGVQVERLGND
jgi:dCMP deaminase